MNVEIEAKSRSGSADDSAERKEGFGIANEGADDGGGGDDHSDGKDTANGLQGRDEDEDEDDEGSVVD